MVPLVNDCELVTESREENSGADDTLLPQARLPFQATLVSVSVSLFSSNYISPPPAKNLCLLTS